MFLYVNSRSSTKRSAGLLDIFQNIKCETDKNATKIQNVLISGSNSDFQNLHLYLSDTVARIWKHNQSTKQPTLSATQISRFDSVTFDMMGKLDPKERKLSQTNLIQYQW